MYPAPNTPTPNKPPYALELRFILLVDEASERLVGLTLRSAARQRHGNEGSKSRQLLRGHGEEQGYIVNNR